MTRRPTWQLSQISGVGQVIISGSALPAVRVELDPLALAHYGVGLEDVRSALSNANANAPKGAVDIGSERWQIYTNDQANHADDYRDLVVAYRNGDALRLRDVADVEDSVQDLRNLGLSDGKTAVIVIVFRQPGANIISIVDEVRDSIPRLKAALPADLNIGFAADRSLTIRASLRETEMTLIIAIVLVVGVVYAFLRNGRAAAVPAVAVPVSIVGTFSAMYLVGFSLDNLSLMALTIATGFVVDDAIIVLENISRRREEGMSRIRAALTGARDVGFTVVTITLSLVAAFLPILLMSGIVGRLFREFAMTLSLAIFVSLAISLTTTPMMCALFLKVGGQRGRSRRSRWPGARAPSPPRIGWHPDALRHAAQGALALAFLPPLGALFQIRDLAQGAINIMAVMLVPVSSLGVSGLAPVSRKLMQRVAGCLAGAALAAGVLFAACGAPAVLILGTAVGVLVGRHIENGGHPHVYVGAQFTLAILVTLVPDSYAHAAISPALDRLYGILVGLALLEPVLVAWRFMAPSARFRSSPGTGGGSDDGE
jgi:multidrug efflux pump subunit AcrB